MEIIDIPKKLHAGDSIDVTATLPSYPASAGWSVSVVIVNGSYNYQVDSTADGDNHSIDALPAATFTWMPGEYKWTAFVVKSTTHRIRISVGDIQILPDIIDDVVSDMRSHAEKVLAAVEAVLEGKATTDDYQVNVRGKMLTRYSYEELIKLRKSYRGEVLQERRAAKKEMGKSGASQIRVRF